MILKQHQREMTHRIKVGDGGGEGSYATRSINNIWMVYFILNHVKSKNCNLLPRIPATHSHTLIQLFIKLVWVNGFYLLSCLYIFSRNGNLVAVHFRVGQHVWVYMESVWSWELVKEFHYLAFTSISRGCKQQIFSTICRASIRNPWNRVFFNFNFPMSLWRHIHHWSFRHNQRL